MPLPANPPTSPASLSSNARTVLEKRYLVKDKTGKPVESPEDMFWRVATVVAEADRRYGSSDEQVTAVARTFYELMTQRRFEPNSPTLMNAGRPLGQLSACFVLPVDDTLSNGESGIYDTLRSMARLAQAQHVVATTQRHFAGSGQTAVALAVEAHLPRTPSIQCIPREAEQCKTSSTRSGWRLSQFYVSLAQWSLHSRAASIARCWPRLRTTCSASGRSAEGTSPPTAAGCSARSQ